MKVLLVQLPACSHDYDYNLANMPLAGGFIGSFVFSQTKSVQLMDPSFVSFASDSDIVSKILEIEPSLVGFTCYLWNVERIIWIAKKLKAEGLKALFVAGGPEVNPDNELLFNNRELFDFFVVGQGEKPLLDILKEPTSKTKGSFISSKEDIEPSQIPSPYLSGFLEPFSGKGILLESSRGCPYRCTYCYYHHNLSKVFLFPIERVAKEIEWAIERRVEVISFVDPSFTSRKDLEELLSIIKRLNKGGKVRFYAELNAQNCSLDLAFKLKKAGFYEVEVGLQSINPRALRAIGRPTDLKAFLKGVKALRKAGIRVMIDLMVGLPEDSPEDVKKAIDFCVEQDVFDELSIYPLSLLPGTLLRRASKRFGIEYSPKPPYYVLKTPWMSGEDIKEIYSYAEAVTGIDYFPPEVPIFKGLPVDDIITEIRVFSFEDLIKGVPDGKKILGQSLKIKLLFKDWWLFLKDIKGFLVRLIDRNPFILISLVLPEEVLPPKLLPSYFDDLFIFRDHLLDREYFSPYTSLRSFQVFLEFNTPGGITFLWVFPGLFSSRKPHFWFITTCNEETFPEGEILKKVSSFSGIDDFDYRVSFI